MLPRLSHRLEGSPDELVKRLGAVAGVTREHSRIRTWIFEKRLRENLAIGDDDDEVGFPSEDRIKPTLFA